jgi:hypothetical protein
MSIESGKEGAKGMKEGGGGARGRWRWGGGIISMQTFLHSSLRRPSPSTVEAMTVVMI